MNDFRVIVRISKLLQNESYVLDPEKLTIFTVILGSRQYIVVSVELQNALNPYNYEEYYYTILALLLI